MPALASGWSESPVSFSADKLSVAGTYLHPSATGKVPAVLLIAGSGPTDRNGNSRGTTGSDELAYLARTLADDGVASLRYNKLGSGSLRAAAMGRYLAAPQKVGVQVFTDQARAALRELAAQPQVDPSRIGVFGHSDGGLYALQLAAEPAAGAPKIAFLGLIEPQAEPILDILRTQVARLGATQHKAGTLSSAQEKQANALLAKAVAQLRAKGTVPAQMKYGLNNLLAPQNLRYLRQLDRIDPKALAAELPRSTRVLLSCSDADIQVTCPEVARISAGLADAGISPNAVRLSGVDHLLKQDNSRGAANYNKLLPFSSRLSAAIKSFVAREVPGGH